MKYPLNHALPCSVKGAHTIKQTLPHTLPLSLPPSQPYLFFPPGLSLNATWRNNLYNRNSETTERYSLHPLTNTTIMGEVLKLGRGGGEERRPGRGETFPTSRRHVWLS